jgi:hypothetical protein
MSGRERDRFVVEIRKGVVMGLPLLMPAPLELELTDDREVAPEPRARPYGDIGNSHKGNLHLRSRYLGKSVTIRWCAASA